MSWLKIFSVTGAIALTGCGAGAAGPVAEGSPASLIVWPLSGRPKLIKVTAPAVSTVEVTKGALTGGSPRWTVLYSIELDNVTRGTLVEASGDIELTNDTHHPVSLVAKIVRADHPGDTPDQGAEIMSGGGGENLLPSVHHGLRARDGEFVAQQDYAKVWVNFVVRADSSDAVPGDQLTHDASTLGRFVVKLTALDGGP